MGRWLIGPLKFRVFFVPPRRDFSPERGEACLVRQVPYRTVQVLSSFVPPEDGGCSPDRVESCLVGQLPYRGGRCRFLSSGVEFLQRPGR